MTVDVTTSTVIHRPLAEVAAFAIEPRNAPLWYAKITSAEMQTPPPLEVGARIAFTAEFLGRRLAYVYEVVELVPQERLVMRTAEGPFPMETQYGWEALDAATTRMTLRNRGEPAGFSWLLGPMMSAALRRATENDLACLKALLESS